MQTVFLFLLLLFFSVVSGQENCRYGKEHPKPTFSANTYRELELKRQQALFEYNKNPENADNIIWLGRRTAYLGDYDKAILIFNEGVIKHPGDARMYRHRGHRYITLRCFDKAVEDLEKAATLVEGKPDETEPDGIPNEKNIPVSTLKTNIWYHLGLAYFLKGDFEKAETAYFKGVSACKNDDMLVAMVNWLYISLLTQGKTEQAENFFALISPSPNLIENKDYLSLLHFYVHKPDDKEIQRYTDAVIYRSSGKPDSTSVSAATLYFGAGYYAKLKGMKEKAILLFNKAIATDQWSSFGYIAAETMLKRLTD
jgi:tetratricopeptide (TPR) repeat protein